MAKDGQQKRYRNFVTVVYLDSAPENFIEIVSNWKIPAFVSPYHDKDFNPDGTPKKPHYHVLIMYDGPKTEQQAREQFSEICGVGMEVVKSLRGYSRYLCHLDSPEKAQYSIEDVWSLGGSDYLSIIELAADEDHGYTSLMQFIDDFDVQSFYSLVNWCSKHNRSWFRLLRSNSIFWDKYLKSRKWTVTNGEYDDL